MTLLLIKFCFKHQELILNYLKVLEYNYNLNLYPTWQPENLETKQEESKPIYVDS